MSEIDELTITAKSASKYSELNEAILDFSLQMAANTEKVIERRYDGLSDRAEILRNNELLSENLKLLIRAKEVCTGKEVADSGKQLQEK